MRLSGKEYCDRYADEARRQMKIYGVPASITLAQGMLESGYGSSYLAVVGNNHFGIKSYRASSWGWAGKEIKCDDDSANEPFCAFSSVNEGYESHSKFLVNNTRYAALFKLKSTDYRGWAKGLQSCGYATSVTYATSLIDLIERYNLDQYDNLQDYHLTSHKLYKTARRGGLPFIICQADDDLSLIADEFGVSVKKLRKWNDMTETQHLHEGDIIYLHRKKTRATKEHPSHVVRAGDSLWRIAQTYGVTVRSVMHRNKLKTARLQLDQVLKLR